MIIRISGEGQYRLDDDEEAVLNALDNAAVQAVEAGEEERFRRAFVQMLSRVRAGTRLGPEDLRPSDLILPPADISLAEARTHFTGEGLIPD